MEDVFAYQWKMSLNLDRAKQAHEVTFLRKCNKIIHRPLYFDNITVKLRRTLAFSLIANSLSANILTIKLARQQKV